MTTEIGTLKQVNPRDAWKNEAKNFTPWIADHIDLLSTVIGMDLTVLECEKSVGPFSADIYAEDEYGDTVVIENQLEKTDHDHLGKLFTYAACLGTKTMVWVTTEARPEHAMAIDRLNSMDDTSRFYLVEIHVIQIDESIPAPMFTLIRAPNEEIKAVRVDAENVVSIQEKNWKSFWGQIKSIDSHIIGLHANVTVPDRRYLEITAVPGLSWEYIIASKNGRAELYFYDNKDLYDKILSHQEEIESDFGESLLWVEKEGVKACRIYSQSNIGGINDKDKWGEIQYDMIDRMVRLKEAIDPYLKHPHQPLKTWK